MGWGTSFTSDVYLSRESFSSRYELDSKVKQIEGWINNYKQELIAYAVATPKDVMAPVNEDNIPEHPFDMILRRVNEIFDTLNDLYNELNKLYQLQEYLDDNKDIDIKTLNG
jgi:hypothetical protein